jgi:hypothetical protein
VRSRPGAARRILLFHIISARPSKQPLMVRQSEHFFSPRHREHIHPHARRVFASTFSTGPPGDRGALHCSWNVIATQQIGLVPFQACGILPVAEEQSRTRGSRSGGVEDQPQCRGLWHSSSPSACSAPSRAPNLPLPRVH